MHKRQDKLRITSNLTSYRNLAAHALNDGFRQGKSNPDTVRIYLFVDTIEALEYILHHSRIQTDDLQSCDVNNAWRRVSECLLFWHFHEKTE